LFYLLAVYPAFWERLYGFVNRLAQWGALNRFVKYYDESVIDMPRDYLETMAKIEARVGLEQIRKYRDIVQRHRLQAASWRGILTKMHGVKLPPEVEGGTYSHFVALVKNRKEWIEKYYKKGIEIGILIEYSIPYMSAYSKFKKTEYPASQYFSKHTINFPI
jgi:perosamine synthetase